jgi:hypothetical protein
MKRLSLFILCVMVSSVGTAADEVNLKTALTHIQVLTECAPRMTGSEITDDSIIGGSYTAALYIADTLRSYGYTVLIEEFPVTTFQITECVLIIDFDGDFSTPDQLNLSDTCIPPRVRYLDISHDVVAPLFFPEETNSEGIPVFDYWLYYDPEYSDVVGHSDIALVYKEGEPAFAYHFREIFSISYEDSRVIKEKWTPETVVWVKFSSHTQEVKGYNVVGINQGGENSVILTAHYDTVYTDGAIDNGSGVAALLETARILKDKNPDATVYFVFVDGEELGLLGSEAFVKMHDLKPGVCINVDSIASGDTIYIGGVPRYEEMWAEYYRTDANLDAYVTSIAEKILDYTPTTWYLEDAGGYSDFVTFMKEEIPSTDITTMDKEARKIPAVSEEKLSDHATMWVRGGRTVYYHEDRLSKVVPFIHTSFDNMDHVNTDIFYSAVKVTAESAYQLSVSGGEVEPAYIIVVVVVAVSMCILWYVKKRR